VDRKYPVAPIALPVEESAEQIEELTKTTTGSLDGETKTTLKAELTNAAVE